MLRFRFKVYIKFYIGKKILKCHYIFPFYCCKFFVKITFLRLHECSCFDKETHKFRLHFIYSKQIQNANVCITETNWYNKCAYKVITANKFITQYLYIQCSMCTHDFFVAHICNKKKKQESSLGTLQKTTRFNRCGVLGDWSTEYWMIYRGPGFLAFVWFGSSPTPSPPPPTVSKPDRRHTGTCYLERVAKGWARSRIMRQQESLGLYKSFKHSVGGPKTVGKQCVL